MLSLVFYFTLINFVFLISQGYKLRRKAAWLLTIISTFLSLLVIAYFLNLLLQNPYNYIHIDLGLWFHAGNLKVHWAFLFDSLALIMCCMVLLVSFLVQVYSYSYLFFDPSLPRFLSYLSLFIFFMVMLVAADNFIVLFLSWEGIGLCSYLLISFWNSRVFALKSALKAILVNRISDFCLLIAICLIFNEFNSLNFLVLAALLPHMVNTVVIFYGFSFDLLSLICFFLLLGAFGKSAQLGFHVWLPDAMEGPTPVSALIHAATLVTAGVFLIIRCSFFFDRAPQILLLMSFIGSVTALISGLFAVVEVDIKKIIAYSTCSQLGYMFFICGLSCYKISLFHLFNHAFFKAALFLCSGSIIHSLSNEQNLMRMGSLKNILPLTCACTFISLLSLNAFPYSSGFYSKELILNIACVTPNMFSGCTYWFGLIASFLTSYYSYRIFYYIFISENNLHKQVLLNINQENILIAIPLLILTFFSLFSGYFFQDLFIGANSSFFEKAIIRGGDDLILTAEMAPVHIRITPLLFSLVGWGVLPVNFIDYLLKFKFFNIYNLLKNEFYFNFLINRELQSFWHKGMNYIYLSSDFGILLNLGPDGAFKGAYYLATQIRRYHTGLLHNYLCIFIFFFFSLIFSVFLKY